MNKYEDKEWKDFTRFQKAFGRHGLGLLVLILIGLGLLIIL